MVRDAATIAEFCAHGPQNAQLCAMGGPTACFFGTLDLSKLQINGTHSDELMEVDMTLKYGYLLASAILISLGSVHSASAQETDLETFCAEPANAEAAECLNLPDGDAPITNFVPFIAPLVGAAVLGGLGGSGGTTGTTSTTSTTSTTGG